MSMPNNAFKQVSNNLPFSSASDSENNKTINFFNKKQKNKDLSESLKYFIKKDFVNTIESSLKLLSNDSNPKALYVMLIYSYLKTKNYQRAFFLLQKALKEYNNSPSLYWLMGRFYLEKEKFSLALKNFKIALNLLTNKRNISSLNPEEFNIKQKKRISIILSDIGKLYSKKFDYYRSLLYFKKALLFHPISRITYKRLAYLFFKIANSYSALNQFKPENQTESEFKKYLFKKAIKFFSLSLSIYDERLNCFVYYWQGVSYFNIGDFQKAAECFYNVLAISEKYSFNSSYIPYSRALLDFCLKNSKNL